MRCSSNPSATRAQDRSRNPLWIRNPPDCRFVYAVWAGWPGTIDAGDVRLLQQARDRGVAEVDEPGAFAYYPDDQGRQAVARRYLRDEYSIRSRLTSELEGLKTFYRYAAELDLVYVSTERCVFSDAGLKACTTTERR